jgi:arginine decarboxylase
VPVFLTPTRNHYGIIGPIPLEEFKIENIQKKIEANPFAKDVKRKPRILTITQSTYDGILYNVETIKEMLDDYIDTLHFDEAWLPHAPSTTSTATMHAIGKNRPRCKESMVFSTQSTHKLLAGLSQASQILVQDSETRKLDRDIFNEAYLMHTSTSPQYAIIASCDVAAAMMEPPGGPALVEESISEALDFRRAMRKVDAEFGDSTGGSRSGGRKSSPRRASDRPRGLDAEGRRALARLRQLRPASTCSTRSRPPSSRRGWTSTATFADWGIPAAIVTKYLAEHGVIVEKTGLYSFFIMFTIGITKGRWNTLVTELQQFKDDYDKQPAAVAGDARVHRQAPALRAVGLKDLCDQIHRSTRPTTSRA